MTFCVILTVHRRQYVEIKCQLDVTEVFIADLIACSTCFGHHYAHHLELKSIIQFYNLSLQKVTLKRLACPVHKNFPINRYFIGL